MRRKIGLASLAIATLAFALTIADIAEAGQRGSWGGRASWGSQGSWGSYGSFGGRFAHWRNRGSWGSHGSYSSNGSFGCHGSHGGYYFNNQPEGAAIHGDAVRGGQARKEQASAREPEVATNPKQRESRYRGDQSLKSDGPSGSPENANQQGESQLSGETTSQAPQNATHQESTQTLEVSKPVSRHGETGPSLIPPERADAAQQ